MTEITVTGYRQFILVSFETLLEHDPKTAHRLKDEFSEVINFLTEGEIFRRRSGHSLAEMLDWLEQDLTVALNEVAPEGTEWAKDKGGRYTFILLAG